MTATINASTSAGVVVTSDTSGSLALQTNSGVTALTIDTSQNVTCVGNITLNNGAADGAQLTLASSGYSNWNIDNYSGNLRAYYNATEYWRTDSSGNLWVRTTGSVEPYNATTGAFAKIGDANYPVCTTAPGLNVILNRNTSTGQIQEFKYNGTAVGNVSVTGSTTAYNTSSDYRLKENIQPMTGALATVAQLNPVIYNWKSDGSDGQGFIAHELQAVVPDCVTGEKDAVDADGKPVYQGVDTSFLVATLVSALQEQQDLIQTLQTQVAQLQAKVGV
jgi:hypothetical protein